MNNPVKCKDLFYYLALFFTALSSTVIGKTYLFLIPYFNPTVKLAALFFYLLTMLCMQWNRKKVGFIGGILMLSFIIAVMTDNVMLISYTLAVILAENMDFHRICKFIFVINFIFIAIVFLLCGLGVLNNNIYIHKGKTAYSMGFVYYSTLAYLVLFLSIIGYYLLYNRRKKLQKLYLIGCMIINYITYVITTVRLTFVCAILFLTLVILYEYTHFFRYKNINMLIATFMYPLMFALSVILPFVYLNNPLLVKLDILLNGRLHFSHMAFERYDITLFGRQIVADAGGFNEKWQNTYFFVDSGYVNLLIGCGVIFCIIVLAAYTLIARYAVKSNNTKLFVWCLVVCIFSFVNNALINSIMNSLPIIIMHVIQNRKTMRNSIGMNKRRAA